MKRLQAYQFQIEPSGEQLRDLRRFAGAYRFVYNKALATQKALHERGEKKLGYAGLCKLVTEERNRSETSWLKDSPVHTLQQTAKDSERAYQNFFEKRADFPRFKKKSRSSDSFRFLDGKQFTVDQANRRIKLPKLGWIRTRNSRDILGTAKNITVSSHGGQWFVSIQTEREVEPPIPASTTAIGIDVGIARFATMSDGSFVAPLNRFKKHQERLAKYQRRMSRKVQYSRNWKKAKAKVQKIHARISNARIQAQFRRADCGYENNADVVGAINVLARGHRVLACGETVPPGRSMKQEPAEVIQHVLC